MYVHVLWGARVLTCACALGDQRSVPILTTLSSFLRRGSLIWLALLAKELQDIPVSASKSPALGLSTRASAVLCTGDKTQALMLA